MNEQELDTFLEEQLGDGAKYIDDDGFTDRVLMVLPSAQIVPFWKRFLILSGSIATAVVLLIALVPTQVIPSADKLTRGIDTARAYLFRLTDFNGIMLSFWNHITQMSIETTVIPLLVILGGFAVLGGKELVSYLTSDRL